MKDYYLILDLNINSSIDEIKKAFRKKAFKYHPDKNTNKDSTEQFRDIYEAYEILSKNELRIEYDSFFESFRAGINLNRDIHYFEENTKKARARSEFFSNINYEDLEIYFRIIFNNIPDIILTLFVLVFGAFMILTPFFIGKGLGIIIGVLIGIPLLIVSIRDLFLIFIIKEKKNKLKSIIIK